MENPFAQLAGREWPKEPRSRPEGQKASGKEIDVFSREVLERHPSLREEVTATFRLLSEERAPLPLVHVTSGFFRTLAAGVSLDGFVEQIRRRGFRARDTNVAAFLDRSVSPPRPATPEYLSLHPEAFVKDLALIAQRYLHHGVRSNKQVLAGLRDQVVGIPALLVIEGGVSLVRGTDHDDHFRFQESWPGEKVMGVVDASDVTSYKREESFVNFLREIVRVIHGRYRPSN